VEEFRGIEITEDQASSPGEIDKAKPWSYLYQSGYLSLRPGKTEGTFALDYPNREVLKSMSLLLMYNFFGDLVEFNKLANSFFSALESRNAEEIMLVVNKLYASISYVDYNAAHQQTLKLDIREVDYGEWLYRSSLLSFLTGCGLWVLAETHGHIGRSDIAFEYKGGAWVFELKVFRGNEDTHTVADLAVRQALEKGYSKRFDNPVILGIAINDKPNVRQITGFKMLQPAKAENDEDGGGARPAPDHD
jgi:hypothetical protein